MNRLIMIGSGGHAKAIMSSLSDLYRENLIGYVDIKEDVYFTRKLKYLGNDEIVAEKYQNESVELILGLSYLGSKVDINLRKKVIDFYLHKNFDFISIISSNAYISNECEIGRGSFIAPGAKIIANAKISPFCSINTGVIIEHDTVIHKNVQIASGSIICGGAKVGENSFVGAGSIIRDGISIPKNTIIGMGSVVTKSIYESGVYLGNPTRKIS